MLGACATGSCGGELAAHAAKPMVMSVTVDSEPRLNQPRISERYRNELRKPVRHADACRGQRLRKRSDWVEQLVDQSAVLLVVLDLPEWHPSWPLRDTEDGLARRNERRFLLFPVLPLDEVIGQTARKISHAGKLEQRMTL
jgi:hypothetical protein